MCGICGIVDFRPDGHLAVVERMNVAICHRGPNDEGYLLANPATGEHRQLGGADSDPSLKLPRISGEAPAGMQLALANRRLSILDLSPAGHNPMPSHDGRFWITYNGEVYNYLELRAELEGHGFQFETGTDTEVILAAYEFWGADCLNRFNGMWAFAIWDVRKKELFCARDRFGIKPFNYFWDGRLFLFGSEIKALLAHPALNPEPRDSAVYDYLVTGSIEQNDDTFFAGIQRLPAAHFLRLDLAEKRMSIQPYWQLEINTELGDETDIEPARLERFQELFEDAVRLRLRSDVPVGTTLSGGLDSSSVVWVVNQLMRNEHDVRPEIIGERQKTFTAYFEDEAIDERPYLEQVLQATGVDGRLVAPEGAAGLWNELEALQRAQDEPFNSTSVYAQWCVMRLAKQGGVTVLLDGQGADEVLGGYNYYLGSFLAQTLRRQGPLAFGRRARQAAPTVLRSALFLSSLGIYNALPSPAAGLLTGIGDRYFRKNTTVPSSLIDPAFASSMAGQNGHAKNAAQPVFADHLESSLRQFSLPALLRYEDRNSMAFSMEARVPFLDYRLVEYVYSLPAVYRVHQGWTKWLLREVMDGKLPDAVTWRRGKLGFATPERRWLEAGRPWIRETMQRQSPAALRYLKPAAIERLVSAAPGPGAWRMVNLEVWLRSFFG